MSPGRNDLSSDSTRKLANTIRAEIAGLESWLEGRREVTRARIDRPAGAWKWSLVRRGPLGDDGVS